MTRFEASRLDAVGSSRSSGSISFDSSAAKRGESASGSASMNRGEENQEISSAPSTSSTCSSCRGYLVYSQAMLEAGRRPVCIGFSSQESISAATLHRQMEARRARDSKQKADQTVDFRYACLGYSLYLYPPLRSPQAEAGRGDASGSPKESDIDGPSDAAAGAALKPMGQLPICTGLALTVLMDQNTNAVKGRQQGAATTPATPQEGTEQRSPPPTSAAEEEARGGERGRSTPNMKYPSIAGMDQDDFLYRMGRNAIKIANKCASNLQVTATSVKAMLMSLVDQGRSK